MPELKRLHADHALAVLTSELAHRTYSAASVSDCGGDFFDQFTERYNALLVEQEAGVCTFYVLVADDGSVLGRFNLLDVEDCTTQLGYRVAQRRRPRPGYRDRPEAVSAGGVVALAAHTAGAAAHKNAASQQVLTKAGFVPAGPADTGGKPGS